MCSSHHDYVWFIRSEIDECATNTDNCDDNALCTDVVGSFECVCNTGFSGDGVSCASESLYKVYAKISFYCLCVHACMHVCEL